MGKRIYEAPACVVTEVEGQAFLLSASLGVNNDPMDDFMGNVNAEQGFTDIWGNEL